MHLDPQAIAAFEALDPVAVGAHVKAVFAEADVSAAEVARRLGWSQPYIARRMVGKAAFTASELVAIAGQVGIEPARLIPETAGTR